MIRSDRLEESAASRCPMIGDNDAVKRALLCTGSSQADMNGHRVETLERFGRRAG
jgi:hypothetical protein